MLERHMNTLIKPQDLRDIDHWVFDLDNTLYPVSANLFDQIDKRMCAYIANYLGLSHAEAYRVQKSYFREHGTSLRGMMENHGMDPGPYLDDVHDIDLSALKRDTQMNAALHQLPGQKVVFTNAATNYALNVLEQLGIRHHFSGVFDIADAGFIPKPEPSPYDLVIRRFGIDPKSAVMVEDIARNLRPAGDRGMKTVWVKTDRPWAHAEADTVTPDFTTTNLSAWLAEVVGIAPAAH